MKLYILENQSLLYTYVLYIDMEGRESAKRDTDLKDQKKYLS